MGSVEKGDNLIEMRHKIDNDDERVNEKLLGGEKKITVMGATRTSVGPTEKSKVYTLNEALEYAGDGLFHKYLILVCGLCMMGVITETLVMSYIISSAECDLSLSMTDKGLLTGAAFFGVVISSHFWGILSDAWGRRNVLLVAVCGCFAASLCSCFSPNALMLILTRTFVGLFVAANAAVSYAYLGEFHSDKTRSKAVTMSGVFMAFGMIYLPALAWAIIPLGRTHKFVMPFVGLELASWRIYLILVSLLNGLVLLGLVFLPESPKFLLSKGKSKETIEVLQKVYKWNGKSKDFNITELQLEDEEAVSKTEKLNPFMVVWTQTIALFKREHVVNTFKTCFLMAGIFFASSGLYLWTPDILNNIFQYKNESLTTCDALKIAYESKNNTQPTDCSDQNIDTFPFIATLGMSIVFALCYFLNGLIVNCVGKRNLLMFWTTVCGLSSIVLIWAAEFHTILVFMLILLTSGCCGSLISAIAIDLFPTSIKAMALSLILMCGRLFAGLGSNLIGYLLLINCDSVFWIVGAALLGCTCVGFTIPGP
uniref:CSON015089 protein n=1 Tax=Culicoides sonorensis TaxID=179676 RepID=A0A336MCI5_CULSO